MKTLRTNGPLLVGAALTLIAVTATAATAPLMPPIPVFRTAQIGTPPKLELAVELPAAPSHLAVYALETAPSGKEQISRLAAQLGLGGETLDNGSGKLALRDRPGEDAQQTLTLFEASGGFFYRYDKELFRIPEEQPRLPDEDTAHKIALDYLSQHGLLPRDAGIERDQVAFSRSRLVEFATDSGKTTRELVTHIEVRFPQVWDGQPVTGPGSKLYVAVGPEGKVLAVTRMWREGQASGAMLPAIAPAEALAYMQRSKGRLATPMGCQNASVEEVSLAYWAESPTVMQRTSLPVYRVQGQCYDAKGLRLGDFEGYAPAVLNESFRLDSGKDHPDPDQDRDL